VIAAGYREFLAGSLAAFERVQDVRVIHAHLGKGHPLRVPHCIPTGFDTALGQLARSILARPSRRRPCHQTVSSVNHSSEAENSLSPPTPPHAQTCCRSITDQESLQAPPIPPWPCHGDDFIETNPEQVGCRQCTDAELLAGEYSQPINKEISPLKRASNILSVVARPNRCFSFVPTPFLLSCLYARLS
jgi:hypothetical protein